MIENNYDNREKLANLIVDAMELDTLMHFVKETLMEQYEENDESFEYDLEGYVDEDGEWNE